MGGRATRRSGGTAGWWGMAPGRGAARTPSGARPAGSHAGGRRRPRASGGVLDPAAVEGLAAARRERAARGRSSSVGRLPGIGAQPPPRRVERAASSPAGPGVGMLRAVEHARAPAALDDAAGVHHEHPVGQLGDDAEVVGDQHDRRCRARAAARCSSSRIWAWMVTSRAVVGSSAISSFGVAGQRHGDHHALAHAAGELVRVVVEPLLRRPGCRPAEQLDRAPARLASGQASMRAAAAPSIW